MSALGKVESVVDSLNNRQEFTYDSMGRNMVVRDALNNTSAAEYDKLGNVTKLAGPLGGAQVRRLYPVGLCPKLKYPPFYGGILIAL